MKLTDFERIEYSDLNAVRKADGVKFIYGSHCAGDFTMAVVARGNYVHIAIAQCGPRDRYNKRRGKYEALAKLYSDTYIALPRGCGFQFGSVFECCILEKLGLL